MNFLSTFEILLHYLVLNNNDKENTKVPGYYSLGNRLLQIHHTRLRPKCSSLNQHLYSKNTIEDPHVYAVLQNQQDLSY